MRPRLVQLGHTEFFINTDHVVSLGRYSTDEWRVYMSDGVRILSCTDWEARQIMAVLNGS